MVTWWLCVRKDTIAQLGLAPIGSLVLLAHTTMIQVCQHPLSVDHVQVAITAVSMVSVNRLVPAMPDIIVNLVWTELDQQQL